MDRIGDGVDRELSRFTGSGTMSRIVAAWPLVVGDEIGRNAWPARMARDGTLRVHTSSSVWAFELGQLAPRILERLTAELGENAPAALRFAPGHVPEPAPPAARSESPAPVTPRPEALADAAALTASIADDELRERVARAAALSLSSSRRNGADDRLL